jgi:hypothetical protein
LAAILQPQKIKRCDKKNIDKITAMKMLTSLKLQLDRTNKYLEILSASDQMLQISYLGDIEVDWIAQVG